MTFGTQQAWFLKIAFVHAGSRVCVCMCLCVCVHVYVCMYACVYMLARLLMTSSTMWHDMWTPYDWLNEFYTFNMTIVVCIISRYGLRIEARHRNQPEYVIRLSYCCISY